MRGLDCRVQGEAWRTSLAAALGRYGRVTACIPTSAQCEELLAARDRAQAESERQLEALQECQEQERDDCRTLSSSLRSAQERERTTQEAYDDCLRQAPTDAVCQPQLRKLEDTTSARAFVTGLQVECLVQ